MEAAEATARADRLARLAEDLEAAQRQCPGLAEPAGQMLQRARGRFNPKVWDGPAAERAFAGLEAVSAQAMWTQQEIDQVEDVVACAALAANEVAETLRRAAAVADPVEPLVDDRAAAWPESRRVPHRDAVPPPKTEVPPAPGAATGFVGLDLAEAGVLQTDLANILDVAEGLGMAFADNVLGILVARLYELAKDVPGTPRALTDLSWVRVQDRFQLIGLWGFETAEELRRRIEVFGAAVSAEPGSVVTATFVFDSPAAARSAAKRDAKAIGSTLKKVESNIDKVNELRKLLERSEERFYDTRYAAGVLNDLGPKRLVELLELADLCDPETRARLYALIGSATRSGGLDDKVEAALLRDPHLNELAESDARLSNDFAAKAADALLDPKRPGDRPMGIDGPDQADLAAAQHLMERYEIASKMDAARLAGLTANPFLPAEVVADMLRLATLADTNRERAGTTLQRILANVGEECSDESKRVLAEAVVADIDELASTLHSRSAQTSTAQGIQALMSDSEARKTVIEGAGQFARGRFGATATQLAAVMEDHPGMKAKEAMGKVSGSLGPLAQAGALLRTLADWEGEGASEVPGLLAQGFGVLLAAGGTMVTGGMSIAIAGLGAAGSVVGDAAGRDAEAKAESERQDHDQMVRYTARRFAIMSLLLSPTEPPLWKLLEVKMPTRDPYSELVDTKGTFVIPEPNDEQAWDQLQDWVESNTELEDAVQIILREADFGS